MTPVGAAAPHRPPDPADGTLVIKVMIVDDSSVARTVLSRMIAAHPEFEIAALAANGEEALATLRKVDVDIVLLDLEMPGTNGLDVLPDIVREGRGARVLIVSSLCEEGAEVAVRALALGAADTLPKPGTGNFAGRFSEILAERLRRIGPIPTASPPFSAAARNDRPRLRLRAESDARPRCIAIGASTGGLHAISEFLAMLPERINIPLLVTQHLPTIFMPFFAKQLEAACGRAARVAEDREALRPDEILVAPGDANLCLDQEGSKVRVRLDLETGASGHLPSVDPMFAALAAVYGKGAMGIVLSGMGRDGLAGALEIADRGGTLLVQDQESSAVWGMPKAVAEAGIASAVLSPGALGRRVAARLEDPSWS
ncbi:MAG: cheB [Alphaproteobacteria bacterium]|nr:cheB [Alphaproteobacteria bacterium]